MSTINSDSRLDPIFTHKAQSDKRTFTFHVKRSAAGELYMTVSQFAKVADEWVRLKMVIPAEDAKPFYQGLCESIRAMRDAEAKETPAESQQARATSGNKPSDTRTHSKPRAAARAG